MSLNGRCIVCHQLAKLQMETYNTTSEECASYISGTSRRRHSCCIRRGNLKRPLAWSVHLTKQKSVPETLSVARTAYSAPANYQRGTYTNQNTNKHPTRVPGSQLTFESVVAQIEGRESLKISKLPGYVAWTKEAGQGTHEQVGFIYSLIKQYRSSPAEMRIISRFRPCSRYR